MSNIETIEYEADEVEAGRMSLEDCEYPNEVEDYLSLYDFDSDGYVINHDNNNYNNSQNNYKNNESNGGHEKTVCTICLLLFVIFFFFCLVQYNAP